MIKKMDRRSFLKISTVSGGGLALGLPTTVFGLSEHTIQNFQPNKFLLFQKDGIVQLFSGRSELGQGSNTNILLMAAEELCIRPSNIKLSIQSPKEGFYVGTGGSWGTAAYYRLARPIFATARQVFINAAAKSWDVAVSECIVENGVVLHKMSDRKLPYTALFDIVVDLPIPEVAETIPINDFKYLGKSNANLHLIDQIIGKAVYGMDYRVPDMLFASIERCLVTGGILKSFDASAAMDMEGVVRVIPLEGTPWEAYDYFPAGVAVLAKDSWTAQEARKKLKIEWEIGVNKLLNAEEIDAIFNERLKEEGKIAYQTGNFDQSQLDADDNLEAIYTTPFWSHSPMEPMNTIAHYQGDRCEIWTPCHAQTRLFKAVKKLTGFADDKIKIHTTLMGGSFGRRLTVDYALEAMLLSKVTGVPIQVQNTRIDETKTGHFMSASKVLVQANIKHQQLDGINFRTVGLSVYKQREPELMENGVDSAWFSDFKRYPYTIPHIKVDQHLANEIQIPVLWWRGTFANTIGFIMESWIDEIAHQLQKDPIEFRMSLLENDSAVKTIAEDEALVDVNLLRQVLTTVRDKSNWHKNSKHRNGLGVACCYSFFESYAAMVADVKVSKKNKLTVKKITCVVDCGIVLNPDMVKAQIEGGIVWALSAMKSGIHFKNGQVVENSFKDYPILKYSEMPDLSIHLIDSQRPVSGVGELSNIVCFAAVCNAIFDACGVRVRKLPLGDLAF